MLANHCKRFHFINTNTATVHFPHFHVGFKRSLIKNLFLISIWYTALPLYKATVLNLFYELRYSKSLCAYNYWKLSCGREGYCVDTWGICISWENLVNFLVVQTWGFVNESDQSELNSLHQLWRFYPSPECWSKCTSSVVIKIPKKTFPRTFLKKKMENRESAQCS